MRTVVAANLVTATREGLCTALAHASVVQFSLVFEFCQCGDGHLHGNVEFDASALG